jgi:hypothetical protein
LREELEAVVGSDELARLLNASGGEITDAKAEDARLALAAAAAGRAEGNRVVQHDEGGGDGG